LFNAKRENVTMDRAMDAAAGAAFELSAAERRLVAERLKAVCERWTKRLAETPPSGRSDFAVAELQNLYDNLVFNADVMGDRRQGSAMEAIIARLAAALEHANCEDYVPSTLLPLYHEIVELTDRFCQERLNDEYLHLCRRAAAALCQEGSPVVRGKPASWACGVVSAVGWVNFLGDPSQNPHVRSEEIAEWFGVSAATLQSKSKTIRDGLDLIRFHPDYTLPSRMPDNPIFQLSGLLASMPAMGPLRDADERRLTTPPERDRELGFRLKITLRDVKPAVWRRVQTPDCTLEELHAIVQAVLGWQDCHMHEFRAGDTRIVSAAMDEFETAPEGSRLETDVWLGDLYAAGETKLDYMYDFGDGWEHAIAIEKALPGDAVGDDVVCTGGAGACPPEDSGGPWGYAEFLEAMADAKHERHEELKEWYGEEFDPKRFEVAEVNRQLENLFE
jgi:hypothetical protein